MDISSEMYKNSIQEYLASINFEGTSWSLKTIKEDLKRMLGYEPAIKISWKNDNLIAEGKKEKPIEKVTKVTVDYFVGGDLNTELQKIEILVGK